MDNCYQVIEKGGTFREFKKSRKGFVDAINFARENRSDVLWKHNGVAETVWPDNVTWVGSSIGRAVAF